MRILIVAFSALFLACENSSEPSVLVIIGKEAGQITIRNQSAIPIYYAAFERASLALINWAPICGQDNQVGSYRTTGIQLTDSSFAPSYEAVVFWWSQCIKRAGSDIPRGEDLHSVLVKIR